MSLTLVLRVLFAGSCEEAVWIKKLNYLLSLEARVKVRLLSWVSWKILLRRYTSIYPFMSPVIKTGSPLQNRTIVLEAAGLPFLCFIVQIGSSMFFFYKSLSKNNRIPKFNTAILANRCENCRLVRTPLDINHLIINVQALERVKGLVFAPVP